MITDWVLDIALAAFSLGVLVGTFIRWGIDQAELACYRRIARETDDD